MIDIIPAIDIIPYSNSLIGSSFGSTWHTLDDNLQHIDRATLNAVGTVLTNVLLKDFEKYTFELYLFVSIFDIAYFMISGNVITFLTSGSFFSLNIFFNIFGT